MPSQTTCIQHSTVSTALNLLVKSHVSAQFVAEYSRKFVCQISYYWPTKNERQRINGTKEGLRSVHYAYIVLYMTHYKYII